MSLFSCFEKFRTVQYILFCITFFADVGKRELDIDEDVSMLEDDPLPILKVGGRILATPFKIHTLAGRFTPSFPKSTSTKVKCVCLFVGFSFLCIFYPRFPPGFSENIYCTADNHNHNYVSHNMQKDFQIRTLTKQLLTKYQISTKLPYLHIHKNRNF